MFRLIVRIISVVLLCFGILMFVDSNFNDFSNDIDLKNPLDVFHIDKPSAEAPNINKPNITKSADSNTDKKENTKKNVNTKDNQLSTTYTQSGGVDKTKTSTTTKSGITEDELNKLIATIRISKETQSNKYNRDNFEKPIKRYNYKGQSLTRNKYAWHVSTHLVDEEPFEYVCPYTGLTIKDMSQLDFDHIVPLNFIFQKGDVNWTKEQMNEYAYDQYIGVDVLNKANRSKSDKGPSAWLPEKNISSYCYSFLTICSKYDIAMPKTDIDVCRIECLNDLENCKMINQMTIKPKDITEVIN